MESCFPLDATKLPKLLLDRPALTRWKRVAQDEIVQLLHDCESWYFRGQEVNQAYKQIYLKKGVEGYTCTAETAHRKEFYAQGILNVRLEDVAYGLYCERTSDQRSVAAFLDEDTFLDAAVVHVDESNRLEDPFRFTGVKWSATRSPPGVTVHSDAVYFEYSCTTRDVDGRTVLVQYTTCPALASSQLQESHVPLGILVRAKNHQITTFRTYKESTLVQSWGTLVANEQIPSWVTLKSVHQAFARLSNIAGLADARAVVSLGVASAVSASKFCYLCKKKFNVLRTKQNCRSCGHSVCKNCTVKVKLSVYASSSALGLPPLLVEDKFCVPCVHRAREQRLACDGGRVSKFADSIVSEDSTQTDQSSFDNFAFETRFSNLQVISDDDSEYDDEALYAANDSSSIPKGSGTIRNYLLSPRQAEPIAPMARRPPMPSAPTPPQVRVAARAAPGPPPTYAPRRANFASSPSAREANLSNAAPPKQRLHPDIDTPRISVAEAFPVAVAESFSKLSQSIAAQEVLLQNMQVEHRKMHAQHQRRAAPTSTPTHPLCNDSTPMRSARIPGKDRFEVVSEAC